MILAQPEYGDALTTYRTLGWVGAAAVMVVVVALVKRTDISPRAFDLLRVISATSLVVILGGALHTFFLFFSQVASVRALPNRASTGVLLTIGTVAGVAAAWFATTNDPFTASEDDEVEGTPELPSLTEPPADDEYDVPPLVTLPKLSLGARSNLPFIVLTSALVAIALHSGLTPTGIPLGGVLDIEPYLGALSNVLYGLLVGSAALLPAWLREDEVSLRPAAAALVIVALAAGLHGHIASSIAGQPIVALLAGLAPGALLPVTLLLFGELYDVVDRRLVWLGATIGLLVLAVAFATAHYALQRRSDDSFYLPARDRLNCPPTCPPDPLPRPGQEEPRRGPNGILPSSFPTHLFPTDFFPSDFPYELFSPTPPR